MRLILLGPPGSGKGTQSQLLARDHHLEHISTGDLLRAAQDQGTPLGLRAKTYMDAGQLVPDELVNDLVAERFRRARLERFVMDGYPRKLSQAASFDALLREEMLDLNAVVLLTVDDEALVRRLSGRRTCPNCKATYHTDNKPPKVPGVCDVCGHALVQRSDDRPETIRARLELVYHKDTVELIPHYRAQGLLREVSGEGKIEDVYHNIQKVLNVKAGPSC